RDVTSGNTTRQFLESTLSNLVSQLGTRPAQPTEAPPVASNGLLFTWGGRLSKLPMGFEFPAVDAAMAWRLWWLGNDRSGHPPYRFIVPLDLESTKQRKVLSDWKFMMGKFTGVCQDAGMSMPIHPTEDDVSRLFVPIAVYIRTVCDAAPRKRTRRVTQLRLVSLIRTLRNASVAQQ
ncbi:hypothetical protein H257_19309, partial [Aphanomyces astaci]